MKPLAQLTREVNCNCCFMSLIICAHNQCCHNLGNLIKTVKQKSNTTKRNIMEEFSILNVKIKKIRPKLTENGS